MLFCSLFAAALAACGGGGGSGSSTAATTVAAADEGASSSAAAAVATAASSADGAATGLVADVDTSASAIGAAAAAADTSASGVDAAVIADAGAGSDGTEASDAGTLSVKNTTTVTVPIAAEGQTFRVPGTMAVRYGAGTSWVTKNVTNSGTCTAAFFGIAASSSVVRSCQALVTVSTGSSAAAVTLGLPASEGSTFYVFGSRAVQFGANGKFVTKTVTGRLDCTNAAFGSDPSPGAAKSCQVAPSGTSAALSTSLMPAVDTAKIPAPATGYSTARVMAANVADPSQVPVKSDIGDFREYCEFSHMSYADPIVAPGGVSGHLHTFLGNTGTNANSTASSIATTGNSTCAGGTLNRTSYWVPALIDTTDGTPQKPLGSLIYYKQGYNYIASTAIRPFPAGLRIVAGSAASSGPQANTGFTCYKTDGTWTTGKSIPTDCPTGATLTIGVAFPQCWDGINLDSPDHKSHMAYPGIGCPATHPVPITGITFNINYKVGPNGTSRWRLSSDNYDSSLPGGYSTHADWFNGWNTDILSVWTTRCINASMDCHAFLIGDGRILY